MIQKCYEASRKWKKLYTDDKTEMASEWVAALEAGGAMPSKLQRKINFSLARVYHQRRLVCAYISWHLCRGIRLVLANGPRAKVTCHFCAKYLSASQWPVRRLCVCWGDPEAGGVVMGKLQGKADWLRRKRPRRTPWKRERTLCSCGDFSYSATLSWPRHNPDPYTRPDRPAKT